MLWPAINSIHTAAMSHGSKSMSRKPASGDTSAQRVRMNEDFRQACVEAESLQKRWLEDYNRNQRKFARGLDVEALVVCHTPTILATSCVLA